MEYRHRDALQDCLIVVVGIALACYGAAEIWLNRFNTDRDHTKTWCEAWMCPEEFTNQRIGELMQRSLAGDRYPLMEFRRAVRSDSASAFEWADLGEAEVNAKDLSKARYCFREAVKAGGSNPLILFRAANFEFQTGDERSTILNLRAILSNPELAAYYEPAFLTLSRVDVPIKRILDEGIPKYGPASEAFLRYLMNSHKIPESQTTWRWIELGGNANDQLAGEYVSFLIEEGDPLEAASAWQQYSVQSSPQYRKTNWVFNGAFDQEPKPCRLDWSLETSKGAQVTRVAKAGHNGGWALRVVFPGDENVNFRQVRQTAVVSPGTWCLRAWIRTEGITTNSGVKLHIFDLRDSGRLDMQSEGTIGTKGWTLVSKSFPVGAETKAITIEFARDESRKFDNKISGTAWLDSIELVPVATDLYSTPPSRR